MQIDRSWYVLKCSLAFFLGSKIRLIQVIVSLYIWYFVYAISSGMQTKIVSSKIGEILVHRAFICDPQNKDIIALF